MGPFSEHFRCSETLAELRQEEQARKLARRQALGLDQASGPRRRGLLQLVSARFRHSPATAELPRRPARPLR